MKPTYRRVLTSYWTDPDVRRKAREPDVHAFLLYLFTGPSSTLSGLYFLPWERVAADIRMDGERVKGLRRGFEGAFFTYDDDTEEILVHRSLRHNIGFCPSPKDNRFKGLLRQVADTHSDQLVQKLVDLYPEIRWPSEVLARGFEGASSGRGFEASYTSTHTSTEEVESSTVDQPPGDKAGSSSLLPQKAMDALRAMKHVQSLNASLASLETSFLYDGDDGLPDASVKGLDLKTRRELVGQAIVQMRPMGGDFNMFRLAGFVRKLRQSGRTKPTTERTGFRATDADFEPGGIYGPAEAP